LTTSSIRQNFGRVKYLFAKITNFLVGAGIARPIYVDDTVQPQCLQNIEKCDIMMVKNNYFGGRK